MKTKKYSLKKDHSDLKKHIKEWEREIDILVKYLTQIETKKEIDIDYLINNLEIISHEMLPINI